MKKFIISFEYKGSLYSAKVIIHKIDQLIIYSTIVMDEKGTAALEERPLIFLETRKGFQLMMLYPGHKTELLKWAIKLQYVDKSSIQYPETFSLS